MESDHVYPEDNGEHDWINDPTEIFQFDPKFDEFDDYFNKSLSITPQIPTTHNLLVDQHLSHWRVMFDFFSMKRHLKSWNPESIFPHDPGGRIIFQFRKYLEKFFCNLNRIHFYDEKQFTILQEGSNRILSKAQIFLVL